MVGREHIRNTVLCISLFVWLFPSGVLSTELHVYLNNRDHVSGKQLNLDESSLSILTAHCGRVVIERSAVKGISRDPEHGEEILEFIGESDVVHNRNGDRLSGQIVAVKDDAILIKAFFAGDKTVTVEGEELDYLLFASREKAQPPSEPDQVRAIFTNDDVISGKPVGFESGRFILDPPYSENLRFGVDSLRSLHNAKLSREFFPGGIAEALVDVLERSGTSERVAEQVYPSLIGSFLKDGDAKGAVLIFRRGSPHIRSQHFFQTIGDEFLANKVYDAAIEAYEKMLEESPTSYYAYTKLFNVYTQMGRYAEAAAIYEQMLSSARVNLLTYGTSDGKMRMDLSDVYIKLNEYDKAIEHLRRVISNPTEQQDIRANALAKLIALFKQQGKIETLIETYNAELARNDKVIGEGYVEMVKIHLNEGRIMKAKSCVERLDELGLKEYAERARQLISE